MTPSVGSYHQRRDADAIDLMTLESTRNWDQLSLQDSYPWLKLDASERRAEPGRAYLFAKRVLDIIVSATALLLLLPVLLLVLIAVKLDHTAAPVFFTQQRTGQGGRTFRIFKFRSMRPPTEEDLLYGLQAAILEQRDEQHPKNAEAADPRITPFGHFIRRTSLDELPQLFNVLRGEMSLVGPRPEEESVVALYDERQRGRLAIKPGLTGPMQVYGRSDLTFEERLAMERDYLDNLSVTGDLAILLRTPRAIVRGEGAY
jgi:lipopolysaccharide/colanic/teichoic acid biosynthesis glycosyltransferase